LIVRSILAVHFAHSLGRGLRKLTPKIKTRFHFLSRILDFPGAVFRCIRGLLTLSKIRGAFAFRQPEGDRSRATSPPLHSPRISESAYVPSNLAAPIGMARPASPPGRAHKGVYHCPPFIQ
jgi:hypothetical protein